MKKGVTLLELLLAIGVLAAIVFLALSLIGFSRTTELNVTADQILELATQARGNSMAGERSTKWGISAVNPTGQDSSYLVFFSCVNDNCNAALGERREQKRIFVPLSILFDTPADGKTIDILFRQRAGDLEGGIPKKLVLYLKNDPRQIRTIDFFSTGLVEIKTEGVLAPTGLSANAASCSQIDLSWSDNSDNEDNFVIERSSDGGLTWPNSFTVSANTTSYSDITVAENTSYQYRIKAVAGSVSSVYSNVVNTTVPACPPPLYVYATANPAQTTMRLSSINVGDPNNLFVAGTGSRASYNPSAEGMAIAGNYVYIAEFVEDRLSIFNISAPTAPSHVGSVSDPIKLNAAVDVAVFGDYAYVTSQIPGSVTSIDISNPANPQVRSTVSGAALAGARDIKISGTFAFVTAMDADAITSVNISDPLNLIIGSSLSSKPKLLNPRGLAVAGGWAYVTSFDKDALTAVNITNPLSMSFGDTYSDANLDQAVGVALSGTYAYVKSRPAGTEVRLTSIDITNPSALTFGSSISFGGSMGDLGIAIVGNHAFMETFLSTLQAVNIGNPLNLQAAGSIQDPSALQNSGDVVAP